MHRLRQGSLLRSRAGSAGEGSAFSRGVWKQEFLTLGAQSHGCNGLIFWPFAPFLVYPVPLANVITFCPGSPSTGVSCLLPPLLPLVFLSAN